MKMKSKKNEEKDKHFNYLFGDLNYPINSINAYAPITMFGNDATIRKKMKSIIGDKQNFELKNFQINKAFNNLDMPLAGSNFSLNKQNSYNSFHSNNNF